MIDHIVTSLSLFLVGATMFYQNIMYYILKILLILF